MHVHVICKTQLEKKMLEENFENKMYTWIT